MATSEVDICNQALLRVGQRQFITALDEDTEEADCCNTIYAGSRDYVLSKVPWKFAKRRATLAVLSSVTRDGWTFCYSLPGDCLTPLELYAGTRNPASDQRAPFDIESDNASGTILLTDTEAASLIYTAKITDVTKFSAPFVETLAWKLAYELALGLALKPAVGLKMAQAFDAALADAIAANFNQGRPDAEPEAEWTRVR